MSDCKKTPDGNFLGFTIFNFDTDCEDCRDGMWSGHYGGNGGSGPGGIQDFDTIYYVAERTSTYRRSNCGGNKRGGSVSYKVRVVSEISQDDADIRAMRLISDRPAAQSYANLMGGCYDIANEPVIATPPPATEPPLVLPICDLLPNEVIGWTRSFPTQTYTPPPIPSLSTSIIETNTNGTKRISYTLSSQGNATWFYSVNGGVSYTSQSATSSMTIDSVAAGYQFLVKVRTAASISIYALRFHPNTGAKISFVRVGSHSRNPGVFGVVFKLNIPAAYTVTSLTVRSFGDAQHAKISNTELRVLGCNGKVEADVVLSCGGITSVYPSQDISINGDCQPCVCACEEPTVADIVWYPTLFTGEYVVVADISSLLLSSAPAWSVVSVGSIISGPRNTTSLLTKKVLDGLRAHTVRLAVSGPCSQISQTSTQPIESVGNEQQIDLVAPNSQTACSGAGFSISPVFVGGFAFPVSWSRNRSDLTGMPMSGLLAAGAPLIGQIINTTSSPINVQFTLCRAEGSPQETQPPVQTPPPVETPPPIETPPPVGTTCCQYNITFTHLFGSARFDFINCYGQPASVSGAPGQQRTVFAYNRPVLATGAGNVENITCSPSVLINGTIVAPCPEAQVTSNSSIVNPC